MTNTMTPVEKREWLAQQYQRLERGELTPGELLRNFRENILNLTQDQYATIVKISRKTLSNIELDKDIKTLGAVDKAFRPLGLKLKLVPLAPAAK
ncbi:MAG: helix-turn-helix domain-containing protein [Shewanella sp.]|nr:helix-turn-helix domain-containing protein [Shewanella sp.]MCF1430107.1 helix-turn-helix domain-containing protein [Shewanella sp.]MCF1437264.1 helix-turn-helix domain-containing protein [Shewanella sp.]MCF1458791.1 helix-turn-helix domain-containing protein [Shewanella sp.]